MKNPPKQGLGFKKDPARHREVCRLEAAILWLIGPAYKELADAKKVERSRRFPTAVE